jgi:hypothetical protein
MPVDWLAKLTSYGAIPLAGLPTKSRHRRGRKEVQLQYLSRIGNRRAALGRQQQFADVDYRGRYLVGREP